MDAVDLPWAISAKGQSPKGREKDTGGRGKGERVRERERRVTLYLGYATGGGLKPGLIELLTTWAQVLKESAHSLECVAILCTV